MKKASAACVVLFAVLVVALGTSQAVHASPPRTWAHPAAQQLARGPTPSVGAPAPAYWDEQLGLTFTQDFTSIAYNVTAVAQSDADGYGPAYLLNGVTDTGYWYQVGISYNWPFMGGGHNVGFNFNYEAFDSTGTSVFPFGGGSGLLPLSGPVNSGDTVLLNLYFSGGQVIFLVRDMNTGATASEIYAAQGTRFIGLSTASDSNGFFTGLMTEWYHVNAYRGTEGEVTYANPSFALASGVLWADEYNTNNSTVLFGSSANAAFVNPTQLLSFSTNGATEYADAYTFITGSLAQELLTLSYSVVGGGSGYSAPVLNYTLDGVQQTVVLTETPVTFFADTGSSWQLSGGLLGSTATERWETAQQTSGSITAPVTEDVAYYHQYLCSFDYVVSGGGTGYSPPAVQSMQFGFSVVMTGGASAWTDSGATYFYPDRLPGSTATERWSPVTASGTITQPQTVVIEYFHQFGFTVSYALAGGGSPTAPTLQGTQFGSAFAEAVTNSSIFFLDPATQWSVPALLLGSNSQERWIDTQETSGTVSGPSTLTLVYQHQFNLTAASLPSAGGTTSLSSSWEDAGSSVQLSQTASQGWQFEWWSGSGTGAYSGSSNSASLLMNSPILENATFYPGLQISAGSAGSVAYSYETQKGTVPAGSSVTIFAPPGTRVLLQATPSSFLYSFAGWTIGANGTTSHPNGGSGETTLTLDSPASAQASFSLNTPLVGGITLGAVLVVAAAVLDIRRRRRSSN